VREDFKKMNRYKAKGKTYRPTYGDAGARYREATDIFTGRKFIIFFKKNGVKKTPLPVSTAKLLSL
jgi:hypothetical protein